MELIAVLFVFAIWDVTKSAVRNTREDYRRETGPKPKRTKDGPRRDPDAAARAHRARGWWARELGSGFAVTRTGLHTGWLAHRTEADRSRLQREEARTLHAEGRTKVHRDVAAFRKRHADARREIEGELAAQRAKGSPATGRKAVRKAADEVARKREERQQQAQECILCHGSKRSPNSDGPCPYCGGAGKVTLDSRGRPAPLPDPPLPADGVRPAEPVVIDTPVRVHNAGDSAHLRPGEPRCEGCGGSGRHPDGRKDACPVCRGFGGAPPEPLSPLAGPDAVCVACGNKERRGDPVLADRGGNIHLSYAVEQQEAYWERLSRLRDPDGSHERKAAEIDDAVIGADHGFEGEHDTHPPATHVPDGACKCGLPACRSGWPEEAPTTTQGAPVTADTNYTTVLATAKAAADQAEQDAVTATSRRATAEQHADAMQAANVQGNCLTAQMDLVDRLKEQETAAQKAGEQAKAVSDHLQKEHGGIQAAVDDAPIAEPAQPGFYGGS